MEFMALKKPVIATNTGGTNELITHNKNGFIVEDNALEHIIEKANFLLDNEKIRFKMGENAYQTIIEKFSLQKMGDSFIDIYTNL